MCIFSFIRRYIMSYQPQQPQPGGYAPPGHPGFNPGYTGPGGQQGYAPGVNSGYAQPPQQGYIPPGYGSPGQQVVQQVRFTMLFFYYQNIIFLL